MLVTLTNGASVTRTISGSAGAGTVSTTGIGVTGLGDGTVTRIDPASAKVVDTIRVGPGPFVLTVAFGDVWSPAYRGSVVWRIRTGTS